MSAYSERKLIKDLSQSVGSEVSISGWVSVRRDQGKMIFLDFRDASGQVQGVVFPKSEAMEAAKKIRPEFVVKVSGVVNKRPERNIQPDKQNGDIELEILEINILNEAKTPPFEITQDTRAINEEVRLKYRYLDLRTDRMQYNIRKRSETMKFMRDHLTEKGFVEISTPILTKTTPEGARDFLVPSRTYPGKFYALPQSPQQYKQLLMVSGFEKYFQFASCFRDEDSRADRAFGEFTQLDIEMSFVEQEDILNLMEDLFTKLVNVVFPEKRITKSPWPRIPHKEALEKYGSDKPDLRENKEDLDELAFAWTIDFPLFTEQSSDDFYHGSGGSAFAPSHHMFTSPHPDDVSLLDTDPLKVRGLQHDMVLNGFEVGGGSIRIHDPKIQEKVFDLIGFSNEQKSQFSHMLEAFTYGVPPHGGIAPGLDRFMMALLGEKSLREVMAFPKTGEGRDLTVGAPSEASSEQLDEIGLVRKPSKK